VGRGRRAFESCSVQYMKCLVRLQKTATMRSFFVEPLPHLPLLSRQYSRSVQGEVTLLAHSSSACSKKASNAHSGSDLLRSSLFIPHTSAKTRHTLKPSGPGFTAPEDLRSVLVESIAAGEGTQWKPSAPVTCLSQHVPIGEAIALFLEESFCCSLMARLSRSNAFPSLLNLVTLHLQAAILPRMKAHS
jgi:hypothetical protein